MKSESGNYKHIYKPSDQEVSVANFENSTLLTGDVRYSAVRAACLLSPEQDFSTVFRQLPI